MIIILLMPLSCLNGWLSIGAEAIGGSKLTLSGMAAPTLEGFGCCGVPLTSRTILPSHRWSSSRRLMVWALTTPSLVPTTASLLLLVWPSQIPSLHSLTNLSFLSFPSRAWWYHTFSPKGTTGN